MEFILHHMPDKLVEVVVGSFLGIFAFFHKRTLANYDRRIRDTETKQDVILERVTNVDREVVKISTALEFLKQPSERH